MSLKSVILLLVISLFVTPSWQAQEDEETNPFVEAAKVLLQDQLQQNRGNGGAAAGLAAVGGLVQNFMQSDSGRQLGDMLLGATKPNNNEGDATADILSGLSSLLTSSGDEGAGNTGGIDPQLISNMVSMFASQGSSFNNGDEDSNNVDVNNNEINNGKKKHVKKANSEPGVDWGNMLGLAANFFAAQQGNAAGGSSGMEGLMNLLPLLMQNTGGSQKNAHMDEEDSQKPSVFAPFIEALYEYWRHFTTSELGQTIWKSSGLEGTLKLFTDQHGNFDMERIYRSLENPSFRRRWVRSLATYVADWVAHISDPATQTRYLATAQFMGNGFLKAQGYHKAQLFDPVKPAESLSRLANAVFKRQFGLKINSATYIKPAVAYLQEVFRLGQAKGLSLSHLTPKEIEDKLTDTINGEVIEPSMRVWRAYRYGTNHPQCDRYVICTVNQRDDAALGTGLKPGVTKLTSLIASWFLSSNTGTPFWKLYNAAVEDHNCPVKYPVDCADFHAEDMKATTEYAHSEL